MGTLKDNSEISLVDLFPGYTNCVYAHWYCGTLQIPQGGLLQYVHGGYASRYERDLLIEVENGLVIRSISTINGKPDALPTSGSYEAGAMATFFDTTNVEGTK